MRRFMLAVILGTAVACLLVACGSHGTQDSGGSGALGTEGTPTITLNNTGSQDVTVYLVFLGGLTGNGGTYTASDFNTQGCSMYRDDRCSMVVTKGTGKSIQLNKGCINISGGLGSEPMGPCPTTMFEINICPPDDPSHDHYDVSLVNGFNHSLQITATNGPASADVTGAKGHHGSDGVYPLGCTLCIATGSQPPQFDLCPGNSASCGDQCFSAAECKSGPDDKQPNAPCDLQATSGGSYMHLRHSRCTSYRQNAVISEG